MSRDNAPVFKTRHIGKGRDRRFVFDCPKCGKTNHHAPAPGFRYAHCRCWPDGYYLDSKTKD